MILVVVSAVDPLIVPTPLLANISRLMLANCKLKAMELYKPSGELAQFTPASEYVVTCMIAGGCRIDPLKKIMWWGGDGLQVP